VINQTISSNKAPVTANFWKKKRVFVTGHTGFKGSWLCQWLHEMGANVRGYGTIPSWHQPPEGRDLLFNELNLQECMDHVEGDVRDGTRLTEALRSFSPEIVMHLAAQPLVRLSYANPIETYETNVMGTAHLLNACRSLPGLRAIMVVTSDKCYQNQEQIWGYRESDPMGGLDPYSNSKGCTELVTSAFRHSYFSAEKIDEHGVFLASGRAGNVIGGGDWCEDRLIPDVFRAIAIGEEVEIRHPNATRPWQHVIEPLAGYLRLIEVGYESPSLASAGWNFGPQIDGGISVHEIMSWLEQGMQGEMRFKVDEAGANLHEAKLLKLDCTASSTHLGISSIFSLEQTLKFALEWYMTKDPVSARAILKSQLATATQA
jgi:CDP-glucose 4,6-dehydratase